MATTVARLEALLTANTKDFDRGMDKSQSKMHSVGKVAGVAGLAIAGGLAVGLDKSVKAALHAQVSQARLEQAFKTSGISASRYKKQVDALETSGRKLGFADEQTKDALGSLLIATHSMAKASRDLGIAQDIARFKHVDLTTATKMLTMAQAGSQRATKQLGLTVQASTANAEKAKLAYHAQKDALDAQFSSVSKMTAAQREHRDALREDIDRQYAGAKAVAQFADKQVTAGKVIDLVKAKLHGQAEEYSKTAAGSMEQFRAQLDHLEVSLGTGLLPILARVSGGLATLVSWFGRHNTVARITITVVTALGAAMLLTSAYTKIAASSFTTKLIPALARSTAAMLGFDAAADANPIGAVTVAVVALSAALVALQVKYQGVTRAIDFMRTHTYLLMAIPVIGWSIGLAAAVVANWNKIGNAIQSVKGLIGTIGGAITRMWAVAKPPIDAMGAAIRTVVKAIQALVDGIKWLIGHIPKIPSFPHIGVPHIPFTSIGDAGGVGPAIKGPASIDPSLYDELGDAYRHSLVLTSGYRPGAITKHGTPSDHGVYPSKAIDVSGAAANMASFFMSLIGDKGVKQAFYDPLGSIFAGVRNAYREGGHSDHVHVATYDKGGWLKPGLTLAANWTGKPERVGGGGDVNITVNAPNYVGSKQELMGLMREAARQFSLRNSRPAFGG